GIRDDLVTGVQTCALPICSPLNPTGTTFSKDGLKEICDLIVAENKRRGENEKPLYLMYDQIYWALTIGTTKHFDPVTLNPEMKEIGRASCREKVEIRQDME